MTAVQDHARGEPEPQASGVRAFKLNPGPKPGRRARGSRAGLGSSDASVAGRIVVGHHNIDPWFVIRTLTMAADAGITRRIKDR